MRTRTIGGVLGAVALGVAVLAAPAQATGETGAGLWPSGYRPVQSECGIWTRDGNDFCVADDPGAVELGVKFTVSKTVRISGVRMYVADPGAGSASVWSADGTLLATGSTASSSDSAWRDVAFSQPLTVEPGRVYIASYQAPNARYAFEYEFFTDRALTVGPITALQSIEGERNGVFCYVGSACGVFPSESYRDLNYWVTPLWSYAFTGFRAPVDNLPTWNRMKAGRAVPVKFSLAGDQGLDILRAGYPTVRTVACPGATTPVDDVEETATAGSSGLTYDAVADQYTYTWKTSSSWAGSCKQFELGLKDGSTHVFAIDLTR